MSKSTI